MEFVASSPPNFLSSINIPLNPRLTNVLQKLQNPNAIHIETQRVEILRMQTYTHTHMHTEPRKGVRME